MRRTKEKCGARPLSERPDSSDCGDGTRVRARARSKAQRRAQFGACDLNAAPKPPSSFGQTGFIDGIHLLLAPAPRHPDCDRNVTDEAPFPAF